MTEGDEPRKARIAAIRARLDGDEARDAWRANVRAAFDELMRTPVEQLVDIGAIERALASMLAPDVVRRALAPALDAALALAMDGAAADETRADAYLSDAARARLDALLDHPKLIQERLARVVLEHDAANEVLREVLYDALKEFNERVNPFFADWGLPALLKRLGPFGLGAMGKSFDSLRAEFDRRLDPEIRKFLAGFSRRATKKTADYVIDKLDAPTFVAVRKQLAARLLEERLKELVPPARDERSALARAVVVETAAHVLSRQTASRALARVVEGAAKAQGKRSLREALAAMGVTFAPDLDAIADAAWPLVRAALASDGVVAWIADLVGDRGP